MALLLSTFPTSGAKLWTQILVLETTSFAFICVATFSSRSSSGVVITCPQLLVFLDWHYFPPISKASVLRSSPRPGACLCQDILGHWHCTIWRLLAHLQEVSGCNSFQFNHPGISGLVVENTEIVCSHKSKIFHLSCNYRLQCNHVCPCRFL